MTLPQLHRLYSVEQEGKAAVSYMRLKYEDDGLLGCGAV
jgi:hypothetical protein